MSEEQGKLHVREAAGLRLWNLVSVPVLVIVGGSVAGWMSRGKTGGHGAIFSAIALLGGLVWWAGRQSLVAAGAAIVVKNGHVLCVAAGRTAVFVDMDAVASVRESPEGIDVARRDGYVEHVRLRQNLARRLVAECGGLNRPSSTTPTE